MTRHPVFPMLNYFQGEVLALVGCDSSTLWLISVMVAGSIFAVPARFAITQALNEPRHRTTSCHLSFVTYEWLAVVRVINTTASQEQLQETSTMGNSIIQCSTSTHLA